MNGPSSPPTWHELLTEALERHGEEPTARFVQLATIAVEPDGTETPANRTVVFRDFFGPEPGLLFISDCRSRKVQQIRSRPMGSACWYFPNTREQFRLCGRVRIVGADAQDLSLVEERRAVWRRLSDSTKAQFGWGRPGSPAQPEISTDVSAEPPETLCLLVLSPSRVDHLRVDVSPHRRTLHQQDSAGRWESYRVNP